MERCKRTADGDRLMLIKEVANLMRMSDKRSAHDRRRAVQSRKIRGFG